MGANTAENTNLRLKAVLDVLAEGVWTGEKLNAGAVLGEAIARVPLNDHERELLSGGIPRGHKTLTTATAKLVKAGWLVKGRSGWTITEDGQRATVAFADPAAFAAALDAGTPVPADTPLPSAPAGEAGEGSKDGATPAAKADEGRRKRLPARLPSSSRRLLPRSPRRSASASPRRRPHSRCSSSGRSSGGSGPAVSVETIEQPEAVAVAGDFNILLGAPANWAPQYDEVPDGTGPGGPALEDRGGHPGRLTTASRSP